MTHTDNAAPPLSIFQLGLWLTAEQRNYNRLDEAMSSLNTEAETTSSDLEEHLMGVIAAMPAVTLADAAVQLRVASRFISRIENNDWSLGDRAVLSELTRSIDRIIVSVAPLVAKAASIDLDALGSDGDFSREHAIIFKGGADLEKVPA